MAYDTGSRSYNLMSDNKILYFHYKIESVAKNLLLCSRTILVMPMEIQDILTIYSSYGTPLVLTASMAAILWKLETV